MDGTEKPTKGYFLITKSTVIVLSLVVAALLVAEGLIIGLAGRPECQVYAPIEATTKETETTTSTTTIITATTVSTEEPGPGTWTSYRLPLNLIPTEYVVSLRPILRPNQDGEYIFYGSSTVRYVCEEPTNHIIMHSKLLDYKLSDWTLLKDGATEITLKSMEFYEPSYFVILETDVPCEKGASYELALSNFIGQLSDDNTGFYRSDYWNSKGEYIVIATSQMQSTGARRTFPCFDEPSFKATFNITLWHNASTNFFSLSNMPVESYQTAIIDSEEWTGTVFEKSVVMPTYLLALVVSDFDYVENRTSGGIQTNIYARPEYVAAGDADYAAIMTPLIMDFFIDSIGIDYSLNKSDQICVPDFSSGAMENWGLVIYREVYLMYNDTTTLDRYKISVTNIIAHELAHQWFGNLVSCEWWDQLWLNEGFATYFSYEGQAYAQPTWKAKERFILNAIRPAFGVDELTTSKPIIREVDSQPAINQMFDTIIYSKGGSILRMVNNFMGEENFVKGNKDYLLAHQYGVANQDQLFTYWEKYTSALSLPTELSTIMETWTLQMGFPVVTVTDQDPLTNTFLVTQEYYLRYPDAIPTHTLGSLKYGYKWYIPFTFKRGSNLVKEEELVWLTPDQPMTLTESDFILGNVRVQGYYRVNYDRDSWDRITSRLDSERYTDIPEENRAQLLDDAYAFSSSGRLNGIVPLQLSTYLIRDDSYIAWQTFEDDIKYYEYMLARTEVYGTFQNYILELVVPSLYDKYGFEDGPRTDDKMIERMTRDVAITLSCYYEHQDCVNKSIQYLSNWMALPDDWTLIPGNYKSVILCAAIRAGGIEEWNFVWERHQASSAADWGDSLRYGLSCSKDPWILNRYLDYALDLTLLTVEEANYVTYYVSLHDYGKDIAWAFMINNWDKLVGLTGSFTSLNALVITVTRRFSTEYDLKLLEDFKETTQDLGELEVPIDSAIETTKANIKWRTDNEAAVTQWLYDNVENIV